jgi:TRAP-type C4-dicarboxylate transport system permease small subunit
MRRVIKWMDNHLEETILVLLLAAISCVMLLQIFMRKVVNSSLPWPEEFCRYCYVWTCFISLGYAMRQGSMLRVAIVMDLFPEKFRKLFAILVNVLCLVVFAVFFRYSIDVIKSIKTMGQTSTAMNLPMYLVFLCTVIGFAFGVIRTIQAIYLQIKFFNQAAQTAIEAIKEEAKAEVSFAQTVEKE